MFCKLYGSVIWCLILTWESSQSHYFKYLFCSFPFLLLIFPLWTYYTICHYPTIICYSVLLFFFQALFSLILHFGCFYWYIFKVRDSFFSCIHLISPSEAFFISVIVLSISNILGVFFFIYMSFLTLPSYPCLLSTFSIRTLSVLITAALNSKFDTSNISAMYIQIVYFCILVWFVIFFSW